MMQCRRSEVNRKDKNNQKIESLRMRLMELQSDSTKNPFKKARNNKEISNIQSEIERLSREDNQKPVILWIVGFAAVLAIIITVMAIRENSEKATKSNSEASIVTSSDNTVDTATDTAKTEKTVDYKVESFELAPNNDYSIMYSRDERFFTVYAYPAGISASDFKIECNWEDYIKISDVKATDKTDKSEISFKVSIDPSILKHSSDATAMITLTSNKSNVESEEIFFPMQGVEISDAEDLTIKIGDTQTATFKVIPASLPLDELKIGMNAYVGNIEAEIVDSEQDFANNCQYVHVDILVTGKHNGLSTGYVNLNDMYQLRGGTCDFLIVE
jgi:hypothetical protein